MSNASYWGKLQFSRVKCSSGRILRVSWSYSYKLLQGPAEPVELLHHELITLLAELHSYPKLGPISLPGRDLLLENLLATSSQKVPTLDLRVLVFLRGADVTPRRGGIGRLPNDHRVVPAASFGWRGPAVPGVRCPRSTVISLPPTGDGGRGRSEACGDRCLSEVGYQAPSARARIASRSRSKPEM